MLSRGGARNKTRVCRLLRGSVANSNFRRRLTTTRGCGRHPVSTTTHPTVSPNLVLLLLDLSGLARCHNDLRG